MIQANVEFSCEVESFAQEKKKCDMKIKNTQYPKLR